MQLPTPHAAFPGGIWPSVPQTQAAALLAVIEQLSRSQYLTEEAVAAARRPQVEALVDHAVAQIPFWRERLAAAGLDAESRRRDAPDAAEWGRRWAALPILRRADVQSLGNALHARQLPAGHGGVAETVTSGSSGRPVRIIRSTLDYFYWQAFQLREHIWRERDLSGSFLSILRNDSSETRTGVRRSPRSGPPARAICSTIAHPSPP
jgi:phenylacetate-CoA ligase